MVFSRGAKRLRPWSGAGLALLLLSGSPCLAEPLFPTTCAAALEAFGREKRRLVLSADEAALFRSLLGELGGRLVVGPAPGLPRWERTKDGALVSRGPDGQTVRLIVRPGVSEPTMRRDGAHVRTLQVPPKFRLSGLDDGGRAIVRRTFLGHPLYPFLVDPAGVPGRERRALDEPELVHREVQNDVLVVGRTLLDAFHVGGREEDQRFLAVSPTGTGKSEMVRGLLRHRIGQSGSGLYLVTSDFVPIVEQLVQEVEALRDGTLGETPVPLRLVRWDGGRRGSSVAGTLKALAAYSARSDEPVVLVTTTSAFRRQVGASLETGQGDEAEFVLSAPKLRALRGMLRYWVYDESHHAGAMQIGRIFEASLDRNRNAAALLVTATPDKRVQALAGGHGFYTYLDEPESWLADRRSAGRTPGEAILQLRAAFDRGDLPSFEDVRPLIFAERKGDPVFDNAGRGKPRELRGEHYGSLFAQVEASVRAKPTLISASSQREALRIAEYFGRRLEPDRPVAVFTSDHQGKVVAKEQRLVVQPLADDARTLFREGRLWVLVSVDRLNEGVNLPPASVLVDLRPDPDPMELLQRLGRLTRTAAGKGSGDLDVYLVNEHTREELVDALDAIVRRSLPSRARTGSGGGPLVLPIEAVLPRILEAGRFDFWSPVAPRPELVSPTEVASYLPLVEALKATFEAATDFDRVLDRFRAALPASARVRWANGLKEIQEQPLPKALLANATSTRSPGHIARIVRVVELYARLKGMVVPETHFREARDFQRVLAPFGYAPSVVEAGNVAEYVPFLDALQSTFVAGRQFSRVIQALTGDLPKPQRSRWRRWLREVAPDGFNENLISSAKSRRSVALVDLAVRVVVEWANRKGIPTNGEDLRRPERLDELFGPFGYRRPVVTAASLESFAPLCDAVRSTFEASSNFGRVTTALRNALPKKVRGEWDRRLALLAPNGIAARFLVVLKTRMTPGPVDYLVAVLETYASLKGLPVPDSHFRDPADFSRLLAPFGYGANVVTVENRPAFEPMLATLKDHFRASVRFDKVLSALAARLPKTERKRWHRGLQAIAPDGFNPEILTAAIVDASVGSTEKVVRVLELYATLQGIPLPASHYADARDLAALLAPFGYAPPVVTAENVAKFLPLLRAVQVKFAASANFAKFLSALGAKIPASAKREWAQGLEQIAPEGFKSSTLGAATYGGHARPANQAVRVLLLYARLRGIAVPVTHFRERRDYEILLRDFR